MALQQWSLPFWYHDYHVGVSWASFESAWSGSFKGCPPGSSQVRDEVPQQAPSAGHPAGHYRVGEGLPHQTHLTPDTWGAPTG